MAAFEIGFSLQRTELGIMRRSCWNARIGLVSVLVLSTYAVSNLGCGVTGTSSFLGLETCEILNCEGLFFRDVAAVGHDEPDSAVAPGDEVVDDHAEDAAGEEVVADVVEEDGHDEAAEATGGDVPPQS
jgi:hypothetical protein